MTAYFPAETLAKLNRERQEIHGQYTDLNSRFISREYKSRRAREYALHGFGRRLGTLVRAIDLVYDVLPPERQDIPERDDVVDATTAIQSFVFNAFGCLDNLAWIWVYEKDVRKEDGTDLDPKSVGLGKGFREVRRSFSSEFRAHLDKYGPWFDYIKGFRDSLAHRIPLYIPPYIVSPEAVEEHHRLEQASIKALQNAAPRAYDRLQSDQAKLGRFRPWMTHSQHEQAPAVVFHAQLLADYATIDEFGRKILEELDR
jgi:hypothetical protein